MPATRDDELDADLAAIIKEAGIDVTWTNTVYKAVIADPRFELDLQTGGFMPEADGGQVSGVRCERRARAPRRPDG